MKLNAAKNSCRTLISGAAVVVLATSFGCAFSDEARVTSDDSLTFAEAADDPTPELISTRQRPVDVDRQLAYMKNVNNRSFWDDLSRAFYTDHPSRLSPYPIMSTSGEPR